MILLDTNIISEPLRPKPDSAVIAWLDRQPVETLYLSSITVAELRFGIAILPEGGKKRLLLEKLEETVLPVFSDRILDFHIEAAIAYAEVRATAREAGFSVAAADGYIAAIARYHHMTVATRDTTPFAAAGLKVINPFLGDK